MSAVIGSFDFDAILRALPLMNSRGGTAWSLCVIYTDFKVSSTFDLYHGEGKPTKETLLAHKKLPQELSHLQLNLRYKEGRQVFPVLSRMKVYYVLHTYLATPISCGKHPNVIEDAVRGASVFWHSGIVTYTQMEEWNRVGQFDSRALHERLQESIYELPFSVSKARQVAGWKRIKGTMAFLCYIRGRVLFGRNVSGPLYRTGTTVSTVKSQEDMLAVPPGQILAIKDTKCVDTLFTFENYTDCA